MKVFCKKSVKQSAFDVKYRSGLYVEFIKGETYEMEIPKSQIVGISNGHRYKGIESKCIQININDWFDKTLAKKAKLI